MIKDNSMYKNIAFLLVILVFIVIIALLMSEIAQLNKYNEDRDDYYKNIEAEVDAEVEAVDLYIKDGTLSNKGCTIIFANNSNKEFVFRYKYDMQKQNDNGEWETLLPKSIEDFYPEGTDWVQLYKAGYEIKQKTVEEKVFDWSKTFGTLKVGKYKLIVGTKEVTFDIY